MAPNRRPANKGDKASTGASNAPSLPSHTNPASAKVAKKTVQKTVSKTYETANPLSYPPLTGKVAKKASLAKQPALTMPSPRPFPSIQLPWNPSGLPMNEASMRRQEREVERMAKKANELGKSLSKLNTDYQLFSLLLNVVYDGDKRNGINWDSVAQRMWSGCSPDLIRKLLDSLRKDMLQTGNVVPPPLADETPGLRGYFRDPAWAAGASPRAILFDDDEPKPRVRLVDKSEAGYRFVRKGTETKNLPRSGDDVFAVAPLAKPQPHMLPQPTPNAYSGHSKVTEVPALVESPASAYKPLPPSNEKPTLDLPSLEPSYPVPTGNSATTLWNEGQVGVSPSWSLQGPSTQSTPASRPTDSSLAAQETTQPVVEPSGAGEYGATLSTEELWSSIIDPIPPMPNEDGAFASAFAVPGDVDSFVAEEEDWDKYFNDLGST